MKFLIIMILLQFFFLLSSSASTLDSHTILLSSCSAARHPDLCVSSIAAASSSLPPISSHKDVIHASINLTLAAVAHSTSQVSLLLSHTSNLTPRERTALRDCLDMLDEAADELRLTDQEFHSNTNNHHRTRNATINIAEDLKILLSAAMTNQQSCIDGFSHEDADRRVRALLIQGVDHVTSMCANALSMINTNFTMPSSSSTDDWVTAEMAVDRVADVVVAADGSGDYKTVSEAVEAAPLKSKKRYVIEIKQGRYEENVEVGKKKKNLMFVGAGRGKTVITASRNVVDGSTTFKSATLAVAGEGFLARDLTIENTAGPTKHQAVALRVNADFTAFYNCDILGYQDTLYVHSLRQFYRNCRIEGTVDFIFGNAAAVLQDCDILARRPNPGQKNMITAHGRIDPDEPTAISIHKCRIGAASDLSPTANPTYLGRPWKPYSRTVIMESEISGAIHPAGWHEWSEDGGVDRLYYGEYKNTGAGAGTAERVKWEGHKVIKDSGEAQQFTAGPFISGTEWLASTGFPYTLGL